MIIFCVFLFIILLIGAGYVASHYTHKIFVKKSRGSKSYAFGKQNCDSALDQCLYEFAQKNDGLAYHINGIALIKENIDAFASRILAAQLAGRSIDLMYYIFEDDRVGTLLLNELLNAADRGVRIRILIDDINVGPRDPIFRALDKHNNIEIRIFNPCRARGFNIKRAIELAFRVVSLTRRMHNKAYIVDGRIAFVGGRNIADAYFGASENTNARDLDVMLTGPVVSEAEEIFDLYWNSAVVIPIKWLVLTIGPKDLQYWANYLKAYASLPLNQELIADINNISFLHYLRPNKYLFPVDKVRVIADPPEKALNKNNNSWLVNFLFSCLNNAKQNVQITSPYFVPGKMGVELLTRLVKKNIKITVLTNSLATTDVMATYGGYIHYRKTLLNVGIKLYELRNASLDSSNQFMIQARRKKMRPPRFHFLVRHTSNLHTKAFLIDKNKAFVGSFNFDMRSVSLNTEMGVYFECKPIAMHMDILFYEEISSLMSYKLTLAKNKTLTWVYTEHNNLKHSFKEPDVSRFRRWLVYLVSYLPIKSQL